MKRDESGPASNLKAKRLESLYTLILIVNVQEILTVKLQIFKGRDSERKKLLDFEASKKRQSDIRTKHE